MGHFGAQFGGNFDVVKEIRKVVEDKKQTLDQKIARIEQLIVDGNRKLESMISLAIEKESISQDQYDKLINLLVEFGKKKGWNIPPDS